MLLQYVGIVWPFVPILQENVPALSPASLRAPITWAADS